MASDAQVDGIIDDLLKRRRREQTGSGEESAEATGGVQQRMEEFNTGLLHEGIAEIVGAPVDAVGQAIARFGEDTGIDPLEAARDPIGGSESLKRFFTWLGFEERQATDATGKIIQAAGRETGFGLPLTGAAGAASRLMRGASQVSRAQPARRAAQEVVTEPLRQAPARAVASDTAAAAATGAGAEGARHLFRGESEGVQQGIGLGTGLTAGTLAGSAARMAGDLPESARRATGALRVAARGIPQEDVAEFGGRRAAERLRGEAADPDAARAEMGRTREEAPDVQPTAAQSSGDPGLIGLERQLAAQDPAFNQRLRQLQTDNNQAVRRLMEPVRPGGDPRAVSEEINARVESALGSLRTRLREAQDRLAPRTETDMAAGEASAAAKAHLESAEREFQNQARQLFEAVDPEGAASFSTARLKQAAQRLRAQRPRTEASEDTPSDLIDAILKPAKQGGLRSQEPFRELRSLRSRVLQEIRTEQSAASPNRNRLRKLHQLRDASQATLDDIANSEQFPDVAQRYEQARRFFAEGAELFREGYVSKALRQGSGEVPGSEFLARVLRSGRGRKESLRQISEAYGSNEAAVEAVRQYAVRSVAEDAADDAGQLVGKRVKAWIDKRDEALNAFPTVKAELRDIEGLQQRIDALRGREQRVSTLTRRSPLREFMGRPPRQAMRRVLNSMKPEKEAAEIRALVRKNPDAESGLRRALWDEMMYRSSDSGEDLLRSPLLAPHAMEDFIGLHEQAFKAVGYSADDLDTLRKAARQFDVVRRTSIPEAGAGRGRQQAPPGLLGTGFTLNQLLSRFYGVQRGVVSGRFIAGEVGSRIVNNMLNELSEEQMEAALKEALVNPQLARDMMEPAAKLSEAQARSITRSLMSQGIISTHDAARIYEQESEGARRAERRRTRDPSQPTSSI